MWADPRPFGSAVETHAYLKEQIKPELQRLVGVAINAAADEMIASEPKPVDEPKPAEQSKPTAAEEPKPAETYAEKLALIKKRGVEGKCPQCGIKLPNIFVESTVKVKSDGSSIVVKMCIKCHRTTC